MGFGLEGKVAIVTGASQGIGEAIAQRLAEEGCKLALVSRRPEKLSEVAAGLTGKHASSAIAIGCDVTVPNDIQAAVDRVISVFGHVDVLINNAGGFVSGAPTAFDALSDDHFMQSYELNMMSAVRFSRAVLPSMRERSWGRIVSISSETAVQPDPIGADYSAAKAALSVFSKILSRSEGIHGIRVNVVSPAFALSPLVETMVRAYGDQAGLDFEAAQESMLKMARPNISVGRASLPKEVAAAVAFLASDEASYVNGTILRVDGGSVGSIGG